MKKIRLVALLIFIASFLGCATVEVREELDPSVSFSGMRSFSLANDSAVFHANGQTRSNFKSTLISFVEDNLKSKGFQRRGKDADVIVRYYLNIDKSNQNPNLGTLTIEMLRPGSRAVLWRGIVDGEINSLATQEYRNQKLYEAVEKALENFPPVVS